MTNMNPDSAEIRDIILSGKATIRQEYVKCGNPDCTKKHGPYLYAYWKDKGKLRKRYVGKSLEDYTNAQAAKKYQIRPTESKKSQYIMKYKDKGNKTAIELDGKLRREQITIESAYKRLKEEISQWRLFVMSGIAKKKNIVYDMNNLNVLFDFISKDMKSKGLDPSNVDVLDSYLKSEIM